MSAKHTATPFQKLSVRIIEDSNGMLVLGFPWGGVNTFLAGKRLESKEMIDRLERAINSHEALLEMAKKYHEFCEDCEGTGRIYKHADPSTGQWIPCSYAEAIAAAEVRS